MVEESLSAPQSRRPSVRRVLGLIAAFFAMVGVELLLLGPLVIADAPHPGALYFLTMTHDGSWLLLAGAVLGVLWLVHRHDGHVIDGWMTRRLAPVLSWRWLPWILGLAVTAVGLVGSQLVMRHYGLSLDEFLVDFQADLIRTGWPFGPVPEAWRWIQDALQPIFMHHDPGQGVWGPRYLPVNGAIVALLDGIGVEGLAHALMAGGSVILLWRVAGDVLPDTPEAQRLALILLASSPQFVVTAMTPYAMTTHLFFNLLWLYLLRRDAPIAQLGALVVGLLAIGIHQLHNFPTFAAPFLLAMAFDRQRRLALIHGAVYGCGIVFWIGWRDFALYVIGAPEVTAADGANLPGGVAFYVERALSMLADRGVHDIAPWLFGAIRFIAWQNPLTIILLILALGRWRSLPPQLRPFAWSILISLLPHVLFVTDQGHGWGYRYLHGVLGNIALLAAWGWIDWKNRIERADEPARPMVVAGALIALTVAVALPLRSYQAAEVVHPYADALVWLLDQPADVVVVANNEAWYSVDLVRNDVAVDREPRLAALTVLGEERLAGLCRHGSVTVVDGTQLETFGIRPATTRILNPTSGEAREILRSAGCYADPLP